MKNLKTYRELNEGQNAKQNDKLFWEIIDKADDPEQLEKILMDAAEKDGKEILFYFDYFFSKKVNDINIESGDDSTVYKMRGAVMSGKKEYERLLKKINAGDEDYIENFEEMETPAYAAREVFEKMKFGNDDDFDEGLEAWEKKNM